MSEHACDVMVLAAHPDDAELGCGGTMLDLTDRGASVVIVDITRGEKGTLGTPETRAAEAKAAAEMLGVRERRNLALPDAGLRDDDTALAAVVGAIRELRPQLLLAPAVRDVHPDHEATGRVARRAFFHSGLRNSLPDAGAAYRPRRIVYYPGNDFVEPTFCVDIGEFTDRKRAVIECYASQVTGSDKHRVRTLDVLARSAARDRYFGSLCGFEAAEPFVSDGPLPLDGIGSLLVMPEGR